MTTATAPHAVRRLAGFLAGLAIVAAASWLLLYAGFKLARRMGWPDQFGIGAAAVVSLGLFLVLERDFRLTRMMGLRYRAKGSWVVSALLLWLLGPAWVFVKATILDPDHPPEQGEEAEQKKQEKQPRSLVQSVRESFETIVFVITLVLLLKLFVTEAFVIPTGSMAETLYGYQKIITCPKCGHEFPVNSHDEVEPNQLTGRKHKLYGYVCPNCRFAGRVDDLNPIPLNRTGDRVLVLKPIYHIREPQRGDVVVFKYPEEPQQKHTAQNYIKRAMGFGDETVAIHRGELFVTRSLKYPADEKDPDTGDPLYPRPDDPKDLWKPEYMYSHAPANRRAAALFEASRKAGFPAGPISSLPAELREYFMPLVKEGWLAPNGTGFVIVRKTEDQVLACRRIVWDNDQQPKDFVKMGVPPRWYAAKGSEAQWKGDNPEQPRAFGHDGPDLDWIRYRHLSGAWNGDKDPHFIDNFLGYNAGTEVDPMFPGQVAARSGFEDRWVGDLILECKVTPADDAAEVVLELSKGVNRFRATFAGGKVTLACSAGPGAREFGSRPVRLGAGRTHTLRFANVDCKLWVWVDDSLVDFAHEGDYSLQPGEGEGWVKENDIEAPASVGARGGVTIRSVKLHRDIYYTRSGDFTQADLFYVHSGHYLCLGDNSAQSSDSRKWGTVPERLMLGKAVFVFWPSWPAVPFNQNRVGLIK